MLLAAITAVVLGVVSAGSSSNIRSSGGCAIDLVTFRRRMEQVSSFLDEFSTATELPWRPLYSQVGCEKSNVGGDGDGDYSPLEYWIVAATIVFTVTVYVFENYLNQRQQLAYEETEFPKQLQVTVSKIDAEFASLSTKDTTTTTTTTTETKEPDNDNDNDDNQDKPDRNAPLLPQLQTKFTKAQSYGLDKISFAMVTELYNLIETVTFLLLGFLPYSWDLAKSLGDNDYYKIEGEIGVSLIFLLITSLLGMITSLPFELYSTFRIEKKHGFNKMTIGLFFSDKLKSLLLSIVIGGPFIALFLKIIEWGGDKFYIYVWVFTTVFSLFMMTIVPVFIMPLFNKYEPLPEGQLKTRIYALADRINYPLNKLFVMDGSKRSTHSNAFMFGFGSNKRIVLYDTLMEQVTEGEILAILGHELGHWKLNHTLTNLVVTQVYTGVMFWCFSLVFSNTDLFAAFGFSREQRTPTIIALLLFTQTIWAPVDKTLSFLLTIFSRVNEFQADKFSFDLDMGPDLKSGLCKIHLENLGAMCPDWLYSTYHYSHPTLVERLERMNEEEVKKKRKKE